MSNPLVTLAEGHDSSTLRMRQTELAEQVVLRDTFATPLRTVAGFTVGFEDGGTISRAAAVLIDAVSLEVIASHIVRLPTPVRYIPGLITFCEVPALLAVLGELPHAPDLAFVDGHGIAHPRRLGIAAHFGVASDMPTIGAARSILVGESRTNLHEMRGAFTPLRDGAKQIGWMLRSKPGRPPLVISPGHRVALASAPELVMRFVTTHRLPETTRLADRLVSHDACETSASS